MAFADDTRAQHSHPGDDPVARLRHTLDVYAKDNVPDDRYVVEATRGIYGDHEVTGLTWGDLRVLADRLGA